MFRLSYVVTLGLRVCKAAMQAFSELVRLVCGLFFVHVSNTAMNIGVQICLSP